MDLELTAEQELLRETVRGLCARHVPLSAVRDLEDDPVGFSPSFWEQLGALGLLGMLIPEEHGGSGMSMLDAAIAYTEFGRAIAPSPHFASAIVSAGVLAASSKAAEWLPRLATGTIVVPAWLEPGGGFGPAGVTTTARDANGGWVLDGVKRHVPFASAAERLLVLARHPGGIGLFLVEASAATLQQQMSVASDTQYQVGLGATPAELVIEDGWPVWERVLLDGSILLAAQAAGGARYALDITVQYAKDRHQFDKPLGAFQALAHYLADAVTAVDGAETLVWEAAWARAESRDISRLAPMAKLFACRTFRDVTAMAQQIFGGVGFTVDYDIQLYFRRAKQQQLSWWNDRYLEELIASDILGAVS